MDRRIDAAALLVAGAALLLVVSLFLDWFGVGGEAGASAWEVFEVLDLVLLGAALAAVAAAFGRLDSRVLLGAAGVALVVVVSQLIQPPPAAQGAHRELGAWLALLAAAGLLAGAALVAAQIAVTVDVRGRERRQRVATVDKRADKGEGADPKRETAAPQPGKRATPGAARDQDATVADRFAPEPAVRLGSRAADPGETQPWAASPDEPAP